MSETDTDTTDTDPDSEDAQPADQDQPAPEFEGGASATIRCRIERLRSLITELAIDDTGGWVNDTLYLTITDTEIAGLASTSSGSVLAYGTYTDGYVDGIELAGAETVEALLNVEKTLEYLDVASGGEDYAELSFHARAGDRLASVLEARGALTARVMLPQSERAFDHIPTDVPERFDAENRLHSPEGNTHDVFVEVTVQTMRRIVEAVDLEDGTDAYPVAVEPDGLSLEVGTEGGRGGIWGELAARDIRWADGVEPHEFTSWHVAGFPEVFDRTLSGQVELQLSEGGPITAVQGDSDRTIRYVIGPSTPQ